MNDFQETVLCFRFDGEGVTDDGLSKCIICDGEGFFEASEPDERTKQMIRKHERTIDEVFYGGRIGPIYDRLEELLGSKKQGNKKDEN